MQAALRAAPLQDTFGVWLAGQAIAPEMRAHKPCLARLAQPPPSPLQQLVVLPAEDKHVGYGLL